jgi:hypothetical protein
MALLRLYKDFYNIVHTTSGDTYSLIDPYALTATTTLDGSTVVIDTPEITHESLGRYCVTMTPNHYSFDKVYELRWHVYYISSAPYRTLKTRFQVRPNNVTGNLMIEVLAPSFDIVLGNQNIDIQI